MRAGHSDITASASSARPVNGSLLSHLSAVRCSRGSARRSARAEQFERLVSALALVIGWEAMVVLRDIRSLDAEREANVVTWATRTLVGAMLAEANDPG